MRRYLLYLGYSGTRLRGVQRQPSEGVSEGFRSVQGYLDAGLECLRPANTPQCYISSRTDAGVHALCNTAHVDLCKKIEGCFYEPQYITKTLNKYFSKQDVDIRIQKTVAVPSGFHARYHAAGRSYLYRLAVLKPQVEDIHPKNTASYLPLAELHRAYIITSPFDVESIVSGSQLFEGSHNFATFMSAPSKNSYAVDPNRAIDSITVTRGRPMFNPSYDPLYENLDFWDVRISARAFLYKQVRRIVGSLVGVAQGKISLECIHHMLDNPAPQNWNPRAVPAPPEGLYLLQVKYPTEVFDEAYHVENSKGTDEPNGL